MKTATIRALAASVLMAGASPVLAAPAHDAEMAAMAARLFPVLSALRAPAAGAVAAMLAERSRRISACGDRAACAIGAAHWTPAERDLVAASAGALLAKGAVAPATDDGVGAEARREIDGLDFALAVYGEGKPSRYPEIDGPDDAVGSPLFETKLADALAIGREAGGEPATALDPSLALTLALLDVNGRDYAIAFDPLEAKDNAGALARARTLDWSRFRYTAIILPGIGPDDPATPVSPTGKLNVRLAAERFADGVAPFIIVTGGSVHPRGSRFTEAVEMRRALVERYGVPADCVVIEPYARHTTTNLRNAVRRLAALRAPLDRDALIVTNPRQSQYIESAGFAERNQRELGYQPGRIGARLSPTELVFRPSMASARVDPMDPRDP
ncbi:MAG: YdcF family protein [Caulobacteraceae bacterium]